MHGSTLVGPSWGTCALRFKNTSCSVPRCDVMPAGVPTSDSLVSPFEFFSSNSVASSAEHTPRRTSLLSCVLRAVVLDDVPFQTRGHRLHHVTSLLPLAGVTTGDTIIIPPGLFSNETVEARIASAKQSPKRKPSGVCADTQFSVTQGCARFHPRDPRGALAR